jgi:hypothetical protein
MNTMENHTLTDEEELARAYIAQNPGTTLEDVIVYLMQGYETEMRREEVSMSAAYVVREYCVRDPKAGTLKLRGQ